MSSIVDNPLPVHADVIVIREFALFKFSSMYEIAGLLQLLTFSPTSPAIQTKTSVS
jgi:hypothetical protein